MPPSDADKIHVSSRLSIPFLLTLACGFVHAQNSVSPPFSVSTTFAGANWRLNGFGQFRVTSPAERSSDLSLSQISLTVTPTKDPKTTVFVQTGITTLDSPDAFLLEGWASREIAPNLRVQVGRFLLPFSRQFLTAPSNLLFPDISAADAAFSAPYAWGSMITMARKRFTASAAAISSPTPVDALGKTAPAGRPGAVGRFEINVLGPFGYQESDPESPETPQLSVGFAARYSKSAFASAAENLMPGDRTAGFTTDLGFRTGRLTFQAAAYGRSAPLGRSLHSRGHAGYAQAGLYVVPHRLEAVARLGDLRFGASNCVESPQEVRERAVGLNWYLRSHYVKVQTDYTWSRVQPFSEPPVNDGRFRIQMQFAF